MLLLEPLFVCIVGVGTAALLIVTAPIWTAAAARLGDWFAAALKRASRTVDSSINEGENVVEGWVVDQPADKHEDKAPVPDVPLPDMQAPDVPDPDMNKEENL